MMGTRKEMMERYRAIDTARNILTSKVGKVVMETNRFPDRQLDVNYSTIDREARKIQQNMDKKMKQFKHNTLLYTFEPTIIVERPPSPSNVFGITADSDVPGYMKPLASRTKTPSNISTIDAFTVKPKKKVNLWEEGYTKEDSVRFRSLLGGSPQLTQEEQGDLHKGWIMLRPLSRVEERGRKKSGRQSGRRRRGQLQPLANDASGTFITQLAATETDTSIAATDLRDRKVKFAKNLQTSRTISRISRADSSASRPPLSFANNKLLDNLQRIRTEPPQQEKGHAEMPTLAQLRMKKNMKLFEQKCQAFGIVPLGQSSLDVAQ